MDQLTFITKLVEALAWPVAFLIFLLLFRKQLLGLISLTQKFKYGDLQVEFDQDVELLARQASEELSDQRPEELEERTEEDRLRSLSEISPNAAILQAWSEVEAGALALLERHGKQVDPKLPTRYKTIQRLLEHDELVDTKKVKIFNDLRRSRNKVAHAKQYPVRPDQAEAYVAVALRLKRYLLERADEAAGAEGSGE